MSGALLAEADLQEIQLELIRRASFNEFDGPAVVASLERHRDLWLSACMDRIGLAHREDRGQLPSASLIKLRDLPCNAWNVDTLFVLTENLDKAQQIAQIAESWLADVITVHDDEDEVYNALGVGFDYGLVSIWWD